MKYLVPLFVTTVFAFATEFVLSGFEDKKYTLTKPMHIKFKQFIDNNQDLLKTHRIKVVIIGGGISGLYMAYKLIKENPKSSITLLEEKLTFHWLE